MGCGCIATVAALILSLLGSVGEHWAPVWGPPLTPGSGHILQPLRLLTCTGPRPWSGEMSLPLSAVLRLPPSSPPSSWLPDEGALRAEPAASTPRLTTLKSTPFLETRTSQCPGNQQLWGLQGSS